MKSASKTCLSECLQEVEAKNMVIHTIPCSTSLVQVINYPKTWKDKPSFEEKLVYTVLYSSEIEIAHLM